MGQARQHASATYLCLQGRSPVLSHTEQNPPKPMTPLSELREFLLSSTVHQLGSVAEGKSLESSGVVLIFTVLWVHPQPSLWPPFPPT